MNLVCLDLEGVLVPEIWIAFAEATGIPELKRTTRDEPDYDKLMAFRLGILDEHGLGLPQIQEVIEGIDPLPGAREFLDALRERTQVVIISDTFEQFATSSHAQTRLADAVLQHPARRRGRPRDRLHACAASSPSSPPCARSKAAVCRPSPPATATTTSA